MKIIARAGDEQQIEFIGTTGSPARAGQSPSTISKISKKRSSKYMSVRNNTLCFALGLAIAVQSANAQCDKKTGFAKKACEVQAGSPAAAITGINDSALSAFKGEPLTTGLGLPYFF